jgi:RHH-type proline utilization regulon transcriptional repressor/proline dehydrogenase/delta 1-pyrroline-5-carboxylate dehydrogenase
MGPLIEPPGAKLAAGLSDLGKGEQWLVEPRQLDDSGRLWSPGVRENVRPRSAFHQTEYFGPVLGIMSARNLSDALAIQNGVDYGLTAGIHSLDPTEVSDWLERVEAGNCYVNRGITGAIVQRQSFGGWKKSSVGPGTKAGGPNYLSGLGSWTRRQSVRDISSYVPEDYFATIVREATERGSEDEAFILRSLASDHEAWSTRFGVSLDPSGLEPERNVLRYRPATVTIRSASFVPVADIVRVCAAGARAGATMHLSVSEALPDPVLALMRATPDGGGSLASYVCETERSFAARMSVNLPERIRLLGGPADSLSVELDGAPEVAIYADEVTESGRVEMLPFVTEQALSITAHRFGAPDPRFVNLPV